MPHRTKSPEAVRRHKALVKVLQAWELLEPSDLSIKAWEKLHSLIKSLQRD